jgi:hypothetical protein
MRITAQHGRHMRQQAPSRWTYLIALLAAVAALIAALSFTSQSGPAAQAQVAAPQAHLPDRAAETAMVSESYTLAQDKAAIARTVLAAERARAAVAAATYTVRPGDSMSDVATRRCGHPNNWTGIYAASRARHWTAANANNLTAGQHLFISCQYVQSMLRYAPAPPPPPPPPPVQATVSYSSSGSVSTYRAPVSYSSGSYSGSGGMQSCIISRESGGSSQVMNGSGHWGLYQFSAQTWAAHGGNPADFGHASVAAQNQVYYSTVAADGYSDWAPYDGC